MNIVDLSKTAHLTDEECRMALEQLYSGRAIVLPVDDDHARGLIQMGTFYLDQQHQYAIGVLKHDYS